MRWKRSDYDYIEDSQSEIGNTRDQRHVNESIWNIRNERHITDPKTIKPGVDDPVGVMYQQILERTQEEQKIEKRHLEKHKQDPYRKLKEFFDDLNSKSSRNNETKSNKASKHMSKSVLHGDNNTRLLISNSFINISQSGSGDTGSGGHELDGKC